MRTAKEPMQSPLWASGFSFSGSELLLEVNKEYPRLSYFESTFCVDGDGKYTTRLMSRINGRVH